MGKAKNKSTVISKDGARRLGAGKIRDRCEAEQQRLYAKGVTMYFRDPKGRDKGDRVLCCPVRAGQPATPTLNLLGTSPQKGFMAGASRCSKKWSPALPTLLPELRDPPSLRESLMFPYLQVIGPILQGIGGCRNDAVLSQLGLKRADNLVRVLNLSLEVQGSLSSGKGENKR